MSQYTLLSGFGKTVINNSENPLNYCLLPEAEALFQHGSSGNWKGGRNGVNCQSFMADYCASEWNDVCEVMSQSNEKNVVNMLEVHSMRNIQPVKTCDSQLTAGDILLVNTAHKKYLVKGSCALTYEHFDSHVNRSPLVSTHDSHCIPVFEVDHNNIDQDPVMNKMLSNPLIVWHILVNIYNTMMRKNTLSLLHGSKLYNFFQSKSFQDYIKSRTIRM